VAAAGYENEALHHIEDPLVALPTPRGPETVHQPRGTRPLIAHCHLGGRTGNGAGVQDHLTTAVTMYREMDMGSWLEKAEALLGPLR
jgi:hypothetical protein